MTPVTARSWGGPATATSATRTGGPATAPVVEHTIHVREGCWGQGIGRRLIEALADRARAAGKRAMVGAIDGENVDSIEFHLRLGFVEVGRLPGIGEKFGRPLDLVLVQLTL